MYDDQLFITVAHSHFGDQPNATWVNDFEDGPE